MRHPTFSPTGHVLFERSDDVQGLWAFPFSLERMERTHEPFRVAETGSLPSISNDGTLVCVVGPDPLFATNQLVWVDRTGKVLGNIGPPKPSLNGPRLSPDGQRVVAFAGTMNATKLWVINVDAGAALPLTHNPDPDLSPYWSADGRSIIFTRFHEGLFVTWSKSADDTGGEQRLSAGRGLPSAAGKYLLLSNPPEGRPAINNASIEKWTYLQLPKTNALPIALSEVFGPISSPAFSPDDRWLAFSSFISGQPEVWTADFPTLSNRVMVSRGGGQTPVWARDGRELFYLSSDKRSLMSARMEPGQARFGEPTKVLDLPKGILTHGAFYEVAADGQRFLMLRQSIDQSVLLVENWFEEHHRR
jgi:Tol biopolymer transport system component